jgi:hypothetical protein
MTDEEYLEWSRDGEVLAAIGRAFFPQNLRVAVRLPKQLAERAVAAWERDGSEDQLPAETPEQTAARHRAASLGLIGLTLQQRGIDEGDEVAVELDAWYIGQALDAAHDDGLLTDLRPPSEP